MAPSSRPVEVRQFPTSTLLPSFLAPNVSSMLQQRYASLRPGVTVPEEYWTDVGVLRDAIERIYISQTHKSQEVPMDRAVLKVHAYMASYDEGESLTCALDDEEDNTTAASISYLPSGEIEGLWET